MSRGSVRLVLTQGPIQSITATAAVRRLASAGRQLEDVLVVGGLDASDERVIAATIRCAAGGEWSSVVTVGDDDELASALPDPGDVAEVLCVRNWQPFNVLLLSRYPNARKVSYGDGIGLIDVTDAPGALAVGEAVVALPQIDRPGAADGLEVTVVPHAELLAVVDAVRDSIPDLTAHDSELAEAARGGLLILTANLTEARMSTPHGELRQFVRLAERLSPDAPVVIKGHPRATLAQATTLARTLRARGHPVTVVDDRFAMYPIEVFSRLAAEVAGVVPGLSSSAISLSYLHGARVDPALPLGLAASTLFPDAVRPARQVVAHHRGVIAALAGWDGRGLIESVPVDPPSFGRRLLALGPKRALAWAPRPPASSGAALEVGALASGEGERVVDPVAGVAWSVRSSGATGLGAAIDSAGRDPAARIAAGAAALAAVGAEAGSSVIAAVLPSTHARPRRARRADVAPANAAFTAERIEQLLESELAVAAREPALASATPGLPPGAVRFTLAARDGAGR